MPTGSEHGAEEQVWPLLNALGKTTDDVEIHQWAFYRHHVRSANTWRQGRVFLAGDAAHLMPPWAGAGMQSGMRDAYNLGWKLGEVLAERLPEVWLDTYEIERRPNVDFFTQLAVGLGRVIKQEATPEEVEAMNHVPENLVTPWEPPLNAPPTLEAGWLASPAPTSSISRARSAPSWIAMAYARSPSAPTSSWPRPTGSSWPFRPCGKNEKRRNGHDRSQRTGVCRL